MKSCSRAEFGMQPSRGMKRFGQAYMWCLFDFEIQRTSGPSDVSKGVLTCAPDLHLRTLERLHDI